MSLSVVIPPIHEARLLERLRSMIEIPSVPGQEKTFSEYFAGEAARLGLLVDVFEPELESLRVHPGYSPMVTSTDYAGRPNVVARRKGSGAGRSLLFNGHSDVVPPGPREYWSSDPWTARVVEGKVFGRGALDAKAGLAAALSALEAIQDSGAPLSGDVLLECVVDEEAGGNGTLASILRGYRADAGVFVEPSGPPLLYTGHRGGLRFRVKVRGQAAQLFARHQGVNAIEKMQVVIAGLHQIREERRAVVKHPAFAGMENPVPLYLGEIRGGSWFSSTPLECTLDGTCGWLPGESLESVKQGLRERLLALTRSDPWLAEYPPELTFPSNWIEPCLTDPNTDFVGVVSLAASQVLGRPPRLGVANSGADMRLRCRYAGMPCVWYGPEGANAHGPDEYVEAGSVLTMARIYAGLTLRWCGPPQE